MSTDALKQAEMNQLKNIEEKYGKKLPEWKEILDASGLQKHGELVNLLKEKYEMTYGNANMLVHMAKQSHAGAVDDQDSLIVDQYKEKQNMKRWYDLLINKINSFGPDVELSPKKAYVSLRRKKQFAIIQPSTKTRMDIGLNIKNEPPLGRVEASGNWNAMCTHRIKIENEGDIDEQVISYIRKAYDQAG